MFRIKVARSTAEIEELRSAWDSLLSPDLTLFQSYRWNRLAAEVFADREEPYFIFAEDDNGAAILPVIVDLASKTISFAGERLFDYRDYLAKGDQSVLERAWQALASLSLPLSITAICRAESGIWNRMPKSFFSRAPRLVHGGLEAEEFARMHSRAFGRLRRLERMGLRICRYSGDSAIVRNLYGRRAQQCSEGELFHDSRRVEFMVAVCKQEGMRCELFTLEHGSTLAAALVTFRDNEFRRAYTTYYDRRWARFSPGVSLLFEISRLSLEEKLSLDLMTGEQGYKTRVAQGVQDLFQVKATSAELRELFPGRTVVDRAA